MAAAQAAGAVCGRFRAAVGLSHLRGAYGPDADRAHPRRGRDFPADQCRHHSAAGRYHRPRSLAVGAGAPARTCRGTAARADRQPVFGNCSAAGRAGVDRRQRHHRSRSRPAVFRNDESGDRELTDRRVRLSQRKRPTHSRRHPGDGERYRQCPAVVRPGPQVVPRDADGECRFAQSSGCDAARQRSQRPGNRANRHPAGFQQAAARIPQGF